MGVSLRATAIRGVAPGTVAEAVIGWCDRHYVVCTPEDSPDAVPVDERLQVHDVIDGWTTLVWPTSFTSDLAAATELARELHAVVAAVGVHDGDVWWSCLYDDERVIDQYATKPEWLASDGVSAKELAPRWRGRPDAVAATVGAPLRDVARLYDRQRRARRFDDREFVSLWRLMGITYPVNPPIIVPVAVTLRIPEDSVRLLPGNPAP